MGLNVHLQDFVSLTRAFVPESAEEMLAICRGSAAKANQRQEYDLPYCPHDIYIADFDLTAAPSRVVEKPSDASKAKAAGVTASVLMAANFPLHPATVIPYTAKAEQLKENET